MSITKTLRAALAADLADIATANGFETTVAEVTRAKPLDELRKPAIVISDGGGGSADIDALDGCSDISTQTFNLLAVVESTGPDAIDDLLDDIKNAIERPNGDGNLRAAAHIVGVTSWQDPVVDEDVGERIYLKVIEVTCRYYGTLGAK